MKAKQPGTTSERIVCLPLAHIQTHFETSTPSSGRYSGIVQLSPTLNTALILQLLKKNKKVRILLRFQKKKREY